MNLEDLTDMGAGQPEVAPREFLIGDLEPSSRIPTTLPCADPIDAEIDIVGVTAGDARLERSADSCGRELST